MSTKLRVSDSDTKNLLDHMAHMHVLSKNDEMSRGMLMNASPDLTKALTSVVKMVRDTDSMAPDDGAKQVAKVLKGTTSNERKMMRIRKEAKKDQTGGNFGSFMAGVGKEALKLAPTLVPIALSLL